MPRWEEAPRSSPLTCQASLGFPDRDVPRGEKSQLTFSDPARASAQSVYFAHRVLHASGGGPSTFPVPLQARCFRLGFQMAPGRILKVDDLGLLAHKIFRCVRFLNFPVICERTFRSPSCIPPSYASTVFQIGYRHC